MTDTVERVALRDVTRQMLAVMSPEEAVRRHMEADGFDRELWASMAEVGLQGIATPEKYGGAGAGWREQALVHEELGRSLGCVPLLSTALATAALLAGTEQSRERWLPSIADGSTIATVAPPGSESGSWYARDVGLVAIESGAGWVIRGRQMYVLDAASADVVILAARSSSGIGVFAVTDVEVEPVATSDRTRRVAHLTLRDTPAVYVGGWETIQAAHRVGVVLLACEQTGGASACLEQSVSYAKTRQQFGRAIGSFQAVQHHCADMLLRVESARSAAYRAVSDLDATKLEACVSALIAGSVCSEAYTYCASMNVQVHGGIGFTWEHPAQLHVKRSRGSAVLLGQPSEHRKSLKATGQVLVGL